ncbi:MAG TPA: hypothetical protein VHV81_01740 [Steroidobacteraceae bacterium]|jgi:hypothetical protein|nr:hypothetical protein [Steroidobacteraceae bacterium]
MNNGTRLASYLALSAACFCAHADVTVEKKTSLDASIMRMHGTNTTSIAADKKRDDTESHCEGMMSLVCGNAHSGEIVRLDRGVTWRLEPDKKSYREEPFATPEQLAEMRARMQANLEKMRSCPASPQQQQVDNSKCQMSPPKIDVHKTDEKASIAGHDAQRTTATLTESCTNKETGDICDTVIAYDLWLTQDKLAGAADRRAFEQAYAKKLGLDDAGVMRGEAARFLAPYQAQIKQLTDKSDDFKGQPLKTSLRVLMGGQQCSAMAKAKSDGSGPSGADSANPMNNVAQAGKALGSLVGGLFKKKKADDSQSPASSDASGASAATGASAAGAASAGAAPAAAGAADPYAQYVQIASYTSETVSIRTDPVPADRFEIPADWKKVIPKPSSAKDNDEFTCPKTGG